MRRDTGQHGSRSGVRAGVEWRYLTPLRVLHVPTETTFVCWAGEWRMDHDCWVEFMRRANPHTHAARSAVFRLELECALWVHGREPEQPMELRQVA